MNKNSQVPSSGCTIDNETGVVTAIPKTSVWSGYQAFLMRCTMAILGMLALATFGAMKAHADYAIVAQDGSGNITFSPGLLVVVILGAIIAAATSAAGIFLVIVGIRAVYKMIKPKGA